MGGLVIDWDFFSSTDIIINMAFFKKIFLLPVFFSLCAFSHALFFKELSEKYQNIELEYEKIAAKNNALEKDEYIARETCRLFEKKILEAYSKDGHAKLRAEIRRAMGAKHTNGFTPVFYAILMKNESLVRSMIDFGADMNETDAQNVTPLLLACSSGKPEIIRIVLEKTRDADVMGKIASENEILSVTPLQYLCFFYDKRNNSSIKQLLEKGADADSSFFAGGAVRTPLLCAALSGNEDFFRMILANVGRVDEIVRVPVDFSSFSGTVLSYICSFCASVPFAWNCAQNLVERGSDVNELSVIGKNELTPLMFLCRQYETVHIEEKILWLLEKNASADKMCLIDGKKLNPFHFVSKYSDCYDSNLFKVFRDSGGDMNKPDGDGISPFDYMKNHLKNFADKTEFSYIQKGAADLSDAGADDWKSRTSSSLTLLHLALEYGDDQNALRILSENLVDWKIPDAKGKSSFDYAVMNHRSAVLDFFLENKIKVGSSFFTILDDALFFGGTDYLRKFLFAEDFSSRSALIDGSAYGAVTYCVKKDDSNPNAAFRKKVLSELFAAGFSVDEKVRGGSSGGDTALLVCAKCGNSEVFAFLLEQGASLFSASENSGGGKTALFYALENGDRKIVEIILGANDFSVTDIVLRDKTTLLMYFAKYATFEELNSVLSKIVFSDAGALERRDGDGMTPFLYAAAFRSDHRIMALFRMYGANTGAKDNRGRNARAIAELHGNMAVIGRLENYGVY